MQLRHLDVSKQAEVKVERNKWYEHIPEPVETSYDTQEPLPYNKTESNFETEKEPAC
jgi:hypothetical protein